MSAPDVTVVIGAYNAMPYLTPCLQSVLDQSIGTDRLEVVAVDDGSTDTTGAALDAFAAAHPGLARVVHQANSGSPSGPRNIGLDLARGRYVFFLDADDYLGPEALERMVAMADEQGSDVVLGKMVGVNGRGVPKSMFTHNQPRADLFTSRLWWTLSATKLFRRSHVQALGLRFPTHYRIGEDQMFTSRAYLAADVLSVVADYDCYYATIRDDGGNITVRDTDLRSRLRFMTDLCALIAEQVEAGPRRDYLLRRPFGIEFGSWVGPSLLAKEPAEQRELLGMAQRLITDWAGDGVTESLRALLRLRYHLIGRGLFEEALEVTRFEIAGAGEHDVVVEDGVAYATYPYFRDARIGAPDHLFDVTRQLKAQHHLADVTVSGDVVRVSGLACIGQVDRADTTVTMVLRERTSGVEHRLPTSPAPVAVPAELQGAGPGGQEAGFTVDVDLRSAAGGAPLPAGLWDLHLALEVRGLTREIRLGSRRSADLDTTRRTYLSPSPGTAPVLATYFTQPHGNLTLDVGEAKHRLAGCLGTPTARWSADGGSLLLTGVLKVAQLPQGGVSIALDDGAGTVHRVPATVRDGRFSVALPLPLLSLGTWSAALSLDLPGGRRDLPLPRVTDLPALTLRRNLRRSYVKPVATGKHLQLRVAPVDLVAGVRRQVGRLVRSA